MKEKDMTNFDHGAILSEKDIKDKKLLTDNHFQQLINIKNTVFDQTGVSISIRTLMKFILDTVDFEIIQQKLLETCSLISK